MSILTKVMSASIKEGEVAVFKDVVILKPNRSFVCKARNNSGTIRRLDFEKNDGFVLEKASVNHDKLLLEGRCGSETVFLDEPTLRMYFNEIDVTEACLKLSAQCKEEQDRKIKPKIRINTDTKTRIKTKSKNVGTWA